MKRFNSIILLLAACFILSADLHAQVGTIKIAKPKTEINDNSLKDTTRRGRNDFFNFQYGYKFLSENFQGKFNTLQNFSFNRPIQLIGINTSTNGLLHTMSRTSKRYMHFLFSQVIPQKLKINETIECKLTGFNFGLGYGGYLTSGNLAFSYYYGFNTGRLRFYDNELVRQKNPYFSPKIGIQPKFTLRNFTISMLVEAEYDISKTSWRKTLFSNDDKITIDNLRQSGYTALLVLGYRI